jgi:catechol 2,3-dioxygenase-like lactoylglutathione lyase family enzyme
MGSSLRSSSAARPVEKYELGVHHMAQPTLDPQATIGFYVDVMGATITHCVASRGWRPNHYDYIHMFLDLGKGDNIAMFYYFGPETMEKVPRAGTHHSFAAASLEELHAWDAWLQANDYQIVQRNVYEVFTSIYVFDPNHRLLEIACNHRPLNEIDAEDGQLTAEALVTAAAEKAKSIFRMWEIKADLIEQRHDVTIEGPAIICPAISEFDWVPDSANGTIANSYKLGNFIVHQADEQLVMTKPDDLPESLWWSGGTGGIKGAVETPDRTTLIIR